MIRNFQFFVFIDTILRIGSTTIFVAIVFHHYDHLTYFYDYKIVTSGLIKSKT